MPAGTAPDTKLEKCLNTSNIVNASASVTGKQGKQYIECISIFQSYLKLIISHEHAKTRRSLLHHESATLKYLKISTPGLRNLHFTLANFTTPSTLKNSHIKYNISKFLLNPQRNIIKTSKVDMDPRSFVSYQV